MKTRDDTGTRREVRVGRLGRSGLLHDQRTGGNVYDLIAGLHCVSGATNFFCGIGNAAT